MNTINFLKEKTESVVRNEKDWDKQKAILTTKPGEWINKVEYWYIPKQSKVAPQVKVTLENPAQSSTYDGANNKYAAKNALDADPKKFTVTKNAKKGENWKADFKTTYGSREREISRIRVLTPASNGERVALADVFVGDKKCGSLPKDTKINTWYDVKCPSLIKGKFVKIVAT